MRPGVVIVEYDSRWPSTYEEERGRILRATGDRIVAIEHVGSTAVPGLAAKPIIDILAGVGRLTDAEGCIAPLASIGYEYVPEYEVELPERRYFRKGPQGRRTHHLHMVERGGEFWQRHLLFRDYLRVHREEARRYEGLKRELAAKFRADREGYTEAKTSYIREVESRARASRRRA